MYKNLLVITTLLYLGSCTTEGVENPQASFTLHGEISPSITLGTSDTRTLINTSTHADSVVWDLGDGRKSNDPQLILQYPVSGTYNLQLTAFNEGGKSTVTTQVKVLDRVLKKIVIDYVNWDGTIEDAWPDDPQADLFVQIQKFTNNTMTKPGLFENNEVLFTSLVVENVNSQTTFNIELPVTEEFVLEKNMLGVVESESDGIYLINLLAKDAKGETHWLLSNLGGGGRTFTIKEENIEQNRFVIHNSFGGYISYELHCEYQ